MDEFLTKEISVKSKDGKMKVTRKRNSAGNAFIRIEACGCTLMFDNQSPDIGHNYEQAALELASLIDEVANNPCHLPKETARDE